MLPKRNRLKRSGDILRVRRLGRAYRHHLAVLLVAPRAQQPGEGANVNEQMPSRFAFTANRRVGTAVARNRGKRLLREALRKEIANVEPGWDCLVIVREATPEADFAAVHAAVGRLLRRADLVVEPNTD